MADFDTLNPLLAIAVIFATGYPAGLLARRLGVPAVTGNILAGVLLGMSGIFTHATARELEPVTLFAMGLMTVVIGGHLSWRRLHNAKRRVLAVAICEVFLTAALVCLVCLLLDTGWEVAILLGSIAVATAPASEASISFWVGFAWR